MSARAERDSKARERRRITFARRAILQSGAQRAAAGSLRETLPAMLADGVDLLAKTRHAEPYSHMALL